MAGGEESQVRGSALGPGERRALIWCAFAAGCICVMPRELVGAAICFGLAGVLGAFHLWSRGRERSRANSPSKATGK